MDASLSSSQPYEFFDAVETQSNHPSLFNFPTAIPTRFIAFSSLLPSHEDDDDDDHCSPFRDPTIFRTPSRFPTPSTPLFMTLAPPFTRKEYAMFEELFQTVNKKAGSQGYALHKGGFKRTNAERYERCD